MNTSVTAFVSVVPEPFVQFPYTMAVDKASVMALVLPDISTLPTTAPREMFPVTDPAFVNVAVS